MKLENIHDLFVICLKDLYSAESQLIEALPKMAKKASNETLKKGFEEHLKQTEEHQKRIEEIASQMDINPKNHVCKGMEGLIAEGSELLAIEGDLDAIDAGLVGAAAKVEHYEMAGYTDALRLATLMGHDDAAKLLEQTLNEEIETEKKLTEVVETEIGPVAQEKVKNMRMND